MIVLPRGNRTSPAERVRARVRAEFGDAIAERLPNGYQRLGSVLVLQLDSAVRPAYAAIGEAWKAALGVQTVLARSGAVTGEFRDPHLERIAGDGSETEIRENGIRYRLDAARMMFARGNQGERRRFGQLVQPGETVVDLFAGIGYFTLPALVHGRAGRVHAVEKNPVAFRYLEENLRINAADTHATAYLGDNRETPVPRGTANRVVLGYLPTAVPWIDRALELLQPAGGTLHVHLVSPTRAGLPLAVGTVRAAVTRAGRRVRAIAGREVKPYGPGRMHAVVDAEVAAR
ncbi:MAG: class I SAM-dependent methyltransferase family protein [Thermoplasmata archaeon]|nr:class I SAM-dependent methyltransferase family protein [Thermoplasmata archaeon]